MPTLIETPSIIKAAGNKPKLIVEYFGWVNSQTAELSIARMKSPEGWIEPPQQPEFDEYTVVLHGMLRVATKESSVDVQAGQAIVTYRGEWVQYSTPEPEGAEYISVCVPAFTPESAHRDA
jgi:mannose-6-phosphate isomerase-like protein (cupin superfamily)